MLSVLAIAGYRSLRDLRVALGPLTVVTGANGAGKSSLYRALRLLADIAQGRIVPSLAAEGGLPSVLWAGPAVPSRAMKRGEQPVEGSVRREPVSLRLGFADADWGYAIDLGLPNRGGNPPSMFRRDPEIKREAQWAGPRLARSNGFAHREGPSVRLLSEAGAWRQVSTTLAPTDSMMTHCADPRAAPELLVLRERMRDWRFYDHLRTDRDAPARRPQVGTHTPALAGDGADLAAALQTIREIGDPDGLDAAVAAAFPRASVSVADHDGLFELRMHQHGLLRPLGAAELSDGTLRMLMLIAILLSPRPPALIVLNEPEASLHPALVEPLAQQLVAASGRSQIVVVSHSPALVEALGHAREARTLVLDKVLGETVVQAGEPPAWTWPGR